MDFSSYLPAIIGGLLGLEMSYDLWRKRLCRHDAESKFPAPEASGALPIIGHLHQLSAQRTVARTLAAMADKHGPVFTTRLGMFRPLVVSNHEAVRECSYAGTYLAHDHADSGFAPYGAHRRAMRKLAVVELLSNHRLEALKHVQTSEVNAFIKYLYSFARKMSRVQTRRSQMVKSLKI